MDFTIQIGLIFQIFSMKSCIKLKLYVRKMSISYIIKSPSFLLKFLELSALISSDRNLETVLYFLFTNFLTYYDATPELSGAKTYIQ